MKKIDENDATTMIDAYGMYRDDVQNIITIYIYIYVVDLLDNLSRATHVHCATPLALVLGTIGIGRNLTR